MEAEVTKERDREGRRQPAREGAMLEQIEEGARRDAEAVRKRADLGEEERSRQLEEIMAMQARQTEALKVRKASLQFRLKDFLRSALFILFICL